MEGTKGIHYIAGVHKDLADAENEQNLSLLFPNDDRSTKIDNAFFITESLKDKTGQQVGTIKIYCESAAERTVLGGFIYRIEMNVQN